MLEIAIDLVGTGSLGCIANPGVGALAALPGGMPITPGIYLIFNPGTANRYMGISANIASRFTSRMTAVTDLGLSTADLAPLRVLWGSVHTRTFPTPANFPYALPTRIAGIADRYDRPHGHGRAARCGRGDGAVSTTGYQVFEQQLGDLYDGKR